MGFPYGPLPPHAIGNNNNNSDMQNNNNSLGTMMFSSNNTGFGNASGHGLVGGSGSSVPPGFQQFPIANPASTAPSRNSFNASNNNHPHQESGLAGNVGVGIVGSVGNVEKTMSADVADNGLRAVVGGSVGSGDDDMVTLMLTAHCTFLSATVTRTVKVASVMFGGRDINHSHSMRRSLANPGRTVKQTVSTLKRSTTCQYTVSLI